MSVPEESGELVSRPVATKRPRARQISRRRKWLLRLIAIAFSFLPLIGFEYALRWCGVGHDTRLIVREPAAESPNTFHFNLAADRSYYGIEDLWGPDPRPFEIPKPAGTFRVVVVGGSTVAGFPYPFELALPGLLEVVLKRQLPERRFEFLNAGMTAIMSSSEVDVVQQAIECQPDLIVVHTGHNEFYGPGGSASNGSLGPGLFRLTRFLNRQRSYQLATSLVRTPRTTHLIASLPADIRIPLDGSIFLETKHRFRANLTSMVDIATRAKIPILLSTVPANLHDLAPLQPPADEASKRRLVEVDKRMSYREYTSAVKVVEEARRTNSADPLLVYRQAQCLEALGRRDEAADLFIQAADLDGCRFRAATSFLAEVRDVAAARPDGVRFCDVAAELRSRSQLPVPGNDFFLEHVHYNLDGTWQVASILGQCIVEDILGASWQPERHPNGPARDELLGVTPLDYLAAESLTAVGYDAWPLNLSPAREKEANLMKARLAAGYQTLDPAERELFADLSMDAMHQHLWLAMGIAWQSTGHADRALEAFQRHIHRRPWDPAGYQGAASALQAQGKAAEAKELLNRARESTFGQVR